MKSLLLKFAHWINKKYNIIIIDTNDNIMFEGFYYKINSITQHRNINSDKNYIQFEAKDLYSYIKNCQMKE